MSKMKKVQDNWGWLAIVLGAITSLSSYIEALPNGEGTIIAGGIIAVVGIVREVLRKLGVFNDLPKK